MFSLIRLVVAGIMLGIVQQAQSMYILISGQLTSTNSLFNLYVLLDENEVYDPKALLTLTSDPPDLISGEVLSKLMGQNDTIFERLQLKEGGTITIYANSSSTNHTQAVYTVDILASILAIILQANPESPDVNYGFTLTIILDDLDGTPWKSDENITFKYNNTCTDCPPSAQYEGVPINQKITFFKAGVWSVTVYVSEIDSQEIMLTVKQPKLKFIDYTKDEIIPSKTDSSVPFNARVGIYKLDSDTEMEPSDLTFTIELSIVCAVKPCSGNLLEGINSVKTVEGSAPFKDLYIKSGGKFYIQAKCAEYDIIGWSKLIEVENSIAYANITLNETNQSAGFPVNVKATLIGEDNNPYVMSETVYFITKNSRYLIDNPRRLGQFSEGTNDGSLEDGIVSKDIYFDKTGENTVKVECKGISSDYSDPILISESKLIISDLNPLPDTVRREFNFFVTMKNNNQSELQTTFSVPISVEVEDEDGDLHSDILSGVTLESTSKGIAYFSNMRFKDGGKYKIVAIFGDSIAKTELMEVEGPRCSVGSGPVSSMCILTFIALVFPLCLWNSDRKIKVFPPSCCSCMILHPITGLFYKQPFARRSLQLLAICASELAMLALIGGLYAYYDTPLSNYDATFEDYYGRQVFKGATGWALSQVISIPLFFINFYMMEKGNLKNIVIFLSIIVIMCSFGAIVGMTAYYCIGYSIYWTANFLIYLAIDLFVMQTLFSIVAIFFMSSYLKQELSKEGNTGASRPDSIDEIPDDNDSASRKNRLYDKV
ncbi:hypothetical protein SteCoe_773 [Stentor coeruleus]|uniref:Uncharacterized protein n=1 Tax=Stentor coeruleus TaxID=5963 RepID=A0A1R2D3C0_9CILI|nr:hypothetical protein SteCoe_773 [Stentor coeruleus]